jgi:hypothetical protein
MTWSQFLHRSVVISAADASHRNKRVSFKSDVQESLKSLRELELGLSVKTYIQNFIPKFDGLFGKKFRVKDTILK